MILAATGHRPDKLSGYDNVEADNELRLLAHKTLARLAPRLVLSGMALGWDQRVAEAALLAGIPFVAALPFAGQESKWPPRAKQVYEELLRVATAVHVVSPGSYEKWKMHKRNEWMVDRASHILALYNGDPHGGTAACLDYANRRQREVINLWNDFIDNRKAQRAMQKVLG